MAGFNLSGIILYSGLSLPIHRYSEHELQANALHKHQLSTKYIIIDEMSKNICMVDKPLHQPTGKPLVN